MISNPIFPENKQHFGFNNKPSISLQAHSHSQREQINTIFLFRLIPIPKKKPVGCPASSSGQSPSAPIQWFSQSVRIQQKGFSLHPAPCFLKKPLPALKQKELKISFSFQLYLVLISKEIPLKYKEIQDRAKEICVH